MYKSRAFPGDSDRKEYAHSVRDQGSVPGSGRYPGEGNGYPHQYSCLESSMDRGAWGAGGGGELKSMGRCKELDVPEQLTHAYTSKEIEKYKITAGLI